MLFEFIRCNISSEFSFKPSFKVEARISPKPFTLASSSSVAFKSFSNESNPALTNLSTDNSPIPSISKPAIKVDKEISV